MARQPVSIDVGGHDDPLSATYQEVTRDEADVTRILAVVPVVTQHEEIIGWDNERTEAAPGRNVGKKLNGTAVSLDAFGGPYCLQLDTDLQGFSNGT
jgi:hypothetical protein